VPCIREILGFYLCIFVSNKGTALSRVAACSVMTARYQRFHYYKGISSTGNIWVGATHATQPHSYLAESIAVCYARETVGEEH